MTKTLLLLLLFLIFCTFKTLAQLPDVCAPGQPPADECYDACILCDLSIYSGSNAGYTGQLQTGCGFTHNDLWLGFIAGEASATFTLMPSNCQLGLGLQMALFTPCSDAFVACHSGTGNGNDTIGFTADLIPGQHYYLSIDGSAADICDFTLTLDPPSAGQGLPVGNNIGPMIGPDTLCPGATAFYSIPQVTNAGMYTWTVPPGWLINGNPSPVFVQPTYATSGTEFYITAGLSGEGNFDICVLANNACYPNGATICKTVYVKPIPTTQLPPVTICNEDLPYTLPWDVQVEHTGLYQHTYESYLGCDSLVQQFVQTKPVLHTNLPPQTVCYGDCISICGQTFCDPGNYSILCQSFQECDSLIEFSLRTLNPFASILGPNQLTCDSSSITLYADVSEAGTIFRWFDGNGTFLSTGFKLTVHTPGTYILTATLTSGVTCFHADTIVVTQNISPPEIQINHGYLSCRDSSIQIFAQSGLFQPHWSWTGPAGFADTLPNPVVMVPGTYFVTVSNPASGCVGVDSTLVIQDTNAPGALATAAGEISCVTPLINLLAMPSDTSLAYAWIGPGFSSSDPNPAVDTGGVYVLTITAANGCSSTSSVYLSGNTLIPDVSVQGATLNCNTPVASLQAFTNDTAASFYWTGPNGFSSAAQHPTNLSEPGLYTVLVTSSNHCTSSATVSILGDFTPPFVQLIGDTIDCNHPAVFISALSPDGFTYDWRGPNGFQSSLVSPEITAPGEYFITVTGLNGCATESEITIPEDFTSPLVQITTPNTLTCLLDTVHLTPTISALVQQLIWSGPSGFLSNDINAVVAEAGVYTLLVTATNGCTTQSTITVTGNQVPPVATASGGIITCFQSSVSLDGQTDGPGSAFEWTGPNGFYSNLADPLVQVEGLYLLTVTGVNGCTDTAATWVGLDILPPSGIPGTDHPLNCTNPVATLFIDQTDTTANYIWQYPSGVLDTAMTVTTAVSGLYQVISLGLNGCSDTASILLTQDFAPPGIYASGDTLDCISGQATLTGSSPDPGVIFNWTGPNNFNAIDPITTATLAGTYMLSVTGVNGCVATATATITANNLSPEVELILENPVINCYFPQVSLEAVILTPNTTGEWSDPGGIPLSGNLITISAPGVYTFSAMAQNGCLTSLSTTISLDQLVPADLEVSGGDLTCTQTAILLMANSAATDAHYVWAGPGSFSSSIQNPIVTLPGTYFLTVTNAENGCSDSTSVWVSQQVSPPVITIEGAELNCLTTTVVLDAITSSPDSLTFVWSGPNGFQSKLEDPSVQMPGQYQVTVTNTANGCSATFGYAAVQDLTTPNMSAMGDTINCLSSTAQMHAISQTPITTYQWSGPNGFTSTLESPETGLHGVYWVTVTGQNGCTATAAATIHEDLQQPDLMASGAVLTCAMDTSVISAFSTQAVDWHWTGPNGYFSSLPNPEISIAGQYAVLVTGANGCVALDSVIVAENKVQPSVLMLPPDELGCDITEITLTGQVPGVGNFQFQWSTLQGNILSDHLLPSILVNKTGDYFLTVTDLENGCTKIEEVTVSSSESLITAANLELQQVRCPGEENGTLSVLDITGGTPPFIYALDDLNWGNQTTYEGLAPGAHILFIQDANGCEYQATIMMEEPVELVVNLGPDTTIHLGDSILIQLEYVVNHLQLVVSQQLSPAGIQTNQAFTPLQSFVYKLSVKDKNGCEASDERRITVNRKRWVYIPNIIVPGSSANEWVTVFGGPDVQLIKSFVIFDRWGDLVFEAINIPKNETQSGWNGLIKDQPANPGVFVYYAKVLFVDGETELFTGDITVMK